jgi:hypothetical protein
MTKESPLYYEVLAAKEQEIGEQAQQIAALKDALIWLEEVQHVANFHNATDWHKCPAVTCVHARRALLMGDTLPADK